MNRFQNAVSVCGALLRVRYSFLSHGSFQRVGEDGLTVQLDSPVLKSVKLREKHASKIYQALNFVSELMVSSAMCQRSLEYIAPIG
mmetsp:Transcript_23148/g.62658  ORF Transcript_23148/g.62658 Transcript_23148/m.62658 type:complete len:86 (+) Transcript_23148:134-391(+)